MPDHALQATFKFGKDYDEAWTTVSSNDPDELLALLDEFEGRLADKIAGVATSVRGLNAAARGLGAQQISSTLAPAAQSAPTQAAPATPAAPAVAAGPLPNGCQLIPWTDPTKQQYPKVVALTPYNPGFIPQAKALKGQFRDNATLAAAGVPVDANAKGGGWSFDAGDEAAVRELLGRVYT